MLKKKPTFLHNLYLSVYGRVHGMVVKSHVAGLVLLPHVGSRHWILVKCSPTWLALNNLNYVPESSQYNAIWKQCNWDWRDDLIVRVCAVFTEDLSWIPSTQIRQLTTVCNSSIRRIASDLHGHLHPSVQVIMCTRKHTHIELKQILPKKRRQCR